MTYTFTYAPSYNPQLAGPNPLALVQVLSAVTNGTAPSGVLNFSRVPDLCAALGYSAEQFIDALDAICNSEDRVRSRGAARRSYREWYCLAASANGRGLFDSGSSRALLYCGVRLVKCQSWHHANFRVGSGDVDVRAVTTSPIVRFQISTRDDVEGGLFVHLTQEGLVYVTQDRRIVWCGSATSSGPSIRNPMHFDRRYAPPPQDILTRIHATIATIFEPDAAVRALRAYADANDGRGYLCGRPLPTALALRAGVRAVDFRQTFPAYSDDGGFAVTARRLPRSLRRPPTPTRRRWSWDRIPEDVARIMAADLTLSIDEPEAR